MRGRRSERGVALIAVLVFVAVAISAVVLFVQRSTYNVLAINNHDASARAEALARGGVRLAQALLIDDRVRENEAEFRADSLSDDWARARGAPITLPNGDALVLAVEDSGARLNLNALFADGAPKDDATETYLLALMEKAIDELPEAAEKHTYDPEELAHNLIDYIDQDEERRRGGGEDDAYQTRRIPTRAANRALLSVDELGVVEGFDATLIEVLRPYVTVFPYQGENAGINPNTAPPWVLALLYTGTSGHYRLVEESEVRRILEIREGGALLCADEANHPGCTPLRSVLPDGVFPTPSFESDVFIVTAEAQSGSTVRSVTAVVDRSELGDPKLLAIQTH